MGQARLSNLPFYLWKEWFLKNADFDITNDFPAMTVRAMSYSKARTVKIGSINQKYTLIKHRDQMFDMQRLNISLESHSIPVFVPIALIT